jgi:hypothetical protein
VRRRDESAASTPDGFAATWFTSRRGRIRVEAIVGGVSLFVLVGPLTVAWDHAPEPLLAAIGFPAATGLVLSVIALVVEICDFPRRPLPEDAAWHEQFVPHHREEEDESEKAVARLVSGKGIAPPQGASDRTLS